jgi:myo-inositol catabolism protein IolC
MEAINGRKQLQEIAVDVPERLIQLGQRKKQAIEAAQEPPRGTRSVG